MRYMFTVLSVMTIVFMTHAIGLQHGIFRSQSTQGVSWTGTAEIIDEQMRITVQEDYLDVELEWTFKASGSSAPAQYADALEIVGNLNLEAGSTVTGMILWYKDRMLKAKLKKKSIARSQYEQVVDRNSVVPPRPRDPVILEYIGSDNYDISIFPVTYNGIRRLRMRYLVPSLEQSGVPVIGFPNAFTPNGVVKIIKGAPIKGFTLRYSNGTESAVVNDSITFKNAIGNMYSVETPRFILPKKELPAMDSSHTFFNVCPTENILLPGEFVRISNFSIAHIIDSVKNVMKRKELSESSGILGIYAVAGNGTYSCSTGVSINVYNFANLNPNAKWLNGMYVYSRTQVQKEIQWHVYFNGESVYKETEQPLLSQSYDPDIASRLYASKRILSLERVLPRSMAATFGFIDTAFALLALEEDSLPVQLASYYEHSGVPVCNLEDIYADSADVAYVPAEGLFQQNQYINAVSVKADVDKLSVALDLFKMITYQFSNGKLIIRINGKLSNNGDLEISLISPMGKMLKRWTRAATGYSSGLEWCPRESGISVSSVIIVVKYGALTQARRVSLL